MQVASCSTQSSDAPLPQSKPPLEPLAEVRVATTTTAAIAHARHTKLNLSVRPLRVLVDRAFVERLIEFAAPPPSLDLDFLAMAAQQHLSSASASSSIAEPASAADESDLAAHLEIDADICAPCLVLTPHLDLFASSAADSDHSRSASSSSSSSSASPSSSTDDRSATARDILVVDLGRCTIRSAPTALLNAGAGADDHEVAASLLSALPAERRAQWNGAFSALVIRVDGVRIFQAPWSDGAQSEYPAIANM